MANLKEKYNSELRPALKEDLGIDNIMAVPKRKQTPSRTGMRRAKNMKFLAKNVVEDKKSGEYRLSHHLDLKTGMYKGRQVIDPKD